MPGRGPAPPKSRSLRSLLIRGTIALAVLATLFVLLIGPPAPTSITIFTGPEGSSFEKDGVRYAEALARSGIEARLVATAGSLENLDSLVAGEAARVGFAEAALINSFQNAFNDSLSTVGDETSEAPDLGLVSLGALYVEPFWLFSRASDDIRSERDADGLVVFPGREGSGTRVLAEALIAVNGLDDVEVFHPDEGEEAEQIEEAFRRGDVDVLFAMGDPMSPSIRALLTDSRIRPVSFGRAEAYDRRFPFIDALTLPEGTVDLADNVPAEDLHLVGSTIQLVTTSDLNPVLVDALLGVANEVHSEATLFSVRGSYPNADPASLPLAPTAERFYSEGFSKWRNYVPFWLATWFDRFAVAVGALAALGLALGVMTRVIAWPFQFFVGRLINRIVKVEQGVADSAVATSDLATELDAIEAESDRLWVPPSERVTYLEFRQLIADVRDRVQER